MIRNGLLSFFVEWITFNWCARFISTRGQEAQQGVRNHPTRIGKGLWFRAIGDIKRPHDVKLSGCGRYITVVHKLSKRYSD